MKARFSQLSNDLFWSIYVNGETIRWVGYNDAYWWNTVSNTDQFQIKESGAKKYRLNPESDEVTEV